MISRIEGELVAAGEGAVEVQHGGLTYDVLVPAADAPTLATLVGRPVRFFTRHLLESQGQGSSYVPRLIGFQTPEDREFFELFTTVKGVGARKALRALRLPFGAVARAIADRDLDVLVTLPEIGRRTAQTIVAELHGKVDRFVELKPDAGAAADAGEPAVRRDAVAVLVQLGEPRAQAVQLVERAAAADPEIETADALVAAAFRLKALID
jgi:Holliday junction DNA helicase RuvA